jgi:ligand-binding sensor domain-containing protein/signal transduction histidine kinase
MPRPRRLALALSLAFNLALWQLGTPARALDPQRDVRQYRHDQWGAEQGFGHSASALLQASDGYLWVGTVNGLFRFDGVEFERLDLGPAATQGQNVLALHEDGAARLWVGLTSGLAVVERGRATLLGAGEGLPPGSIYAVGSTADGTIWIGSDNGLHKGRATPRWQFRTDDSCGSDRYRARGLMTARDGTLWVAGTREGGLRRVGDGRCTIYSTGDGLADANVISVHEDRHGQIWAGTQRGLCRLQAGRFSCLTTRDGLSNDAIRSITSDRDGNLWLGTVAGGLNRFRDGRFAVVAASDGLMGNRVFDLAEDREGSLWLATRGGLERLKDAPFAPLVTGQGVLRTAARTVLGGRDGSLWIGTEGDGLLQVAGAEVRAFTARQGLPDGIVSSLLETPDGLLWVGTTHGLVVLDKGRFRPLDARVGLTDGNVRVLYRDGRGTVWVGTDGGGLFQWNGSRFIAHLPGASVHALHEDAAGSLWVGTSQGLIRRAQGRVDRFTTRHGLSSDLILSFLDGGDGSTLWIGTANGLTRHRRERGVFNAYTRKQGLFEERVHHLFDDRRGSLWLTSGVGVFRLEKRALSELDAGRVATIGFTHYGIADGLPSIDCAGDRQPAGWQAPDGTLFIPTLRGVATLDPRWTGPRPVPMPIHIQRMVVNGSAAPAVEGVRLPAGVRSLELRWAGLSFRAPTRSRFRYRLEGYEADWVEASAQRSAHYGRLPPGGYRFRIIGASSDGHWNTEGASLAFTVAPHFHQTPWFKLLVAVAVAALAVALHRLRVRGLRAKFAAVLTERGRMARELHDGLDQTLSAAGMQLQVAAQLLRAGPDRDQALASLDRARHCLDQALEEGRRSVWALRSQALEQGDLPAAFVRLCRELGAGTSVAIRLDVEGDPRGLPAKVEGHVLRVGQEAITNALRHGSPRAIVVTLDFAPARLTLRVRDDGQGFDPRTVTPGLGLRGIHERARELGATITVDSRPGETEVALEIPTPRGWVPMLTK